MRPSRSPTPNVRRYRRGVTGGLAKTVVLASAAALVFSSLSLSAITAAITVPQGADRPAIGPPAFAGNADFQLGLRQPIPRAAFERVSGIPSLNTPGVFGGDRVYDISVDGKAYRVHEFTTVGTSTLTVNTTVEVDVLVVGGGGGGGGSIGGGGGAGEFVEKVGPNQVQLDTANSPYTIVVGAGGDGGDYATVNTLSPAADGQDGAASSAFGIVAAGGGGGGALMRPGKPGGSGGGAGSVFTTDSGGASTATQGQGSNGGAGSCGTCGSDAAVAGGGGGAGGPGFASVNQQGGNGGPGLSSTITGSTMWYAGGGGGGINSDASARSTGPSGQGAAGGGNGGDYGDRAPAGSEHFGVDALPNTGSGGGGAGNKLNHNGRLGGNGGSGVVIVRYELPGNTWRPISLTGGDEVTETVVNGVRYREHRFTQAGTRTVPLSVPGTTGEFEVLLVGGGGGGGADSGGGGGGGALLEGRVTLDGAGARDVTVTVGAGGSRGRWTSPGELSGAGGASTVTVVAGGVTALSATAPGGRGGPKNDRNTVNTNGGLNTGAGGVTPSIPDVSGATWQSLTLRAGGNGAPTAGAGYEGARGSAGKPAPDGGGSAQLFAGSFGGGGGGGSSDNEATAAGTNGGGRGAGSNFDICKIGLRALPGAPNSGGGGGGGSAYGPGAGCTNPEGLNTRDGEPGGTGIVIIRYPITREITSLPSAVRDLMVAEGNTSALLRWAEPLIDTPVANASGYRIAYQAVSGGSWTTVDASQITYTTSVSGGQNLVTVALTGIPSTSRHRFRVIPVGSVDGPSTIVAAIAKGGDTVSFVGRDVVHLYTTVGDAHFAVGDARPVSALIVAGGGGGGSDNAGGGGGGGVLALPHVVLESDSNVTVVVGAGGDPSGVNNANLQTNGDDSMFHTFTAIGGGQGGNGQPGAREATTGGSGGGGHGERFSGSNPSTDGAAGTPGQGHAGGNGNTSSTPNAGDGGGGGGAGEAGQHAASGQPGRGGNGFASSITGQQWLYGSGGGGGTHRSSSSSRASGAGGTRLGGGLGGVLGDNDASDGEDGFGGGGGGSATTSMSGGAGGSGAVIVRYMFDMPSVRNLVAAESATTAILHWQEPDSPSIPSRNAAGYLIEYAPVGSDTWTTITPTNVTFTAPDMLQASVSPPQTTGLYRFRVTPQLFTLGAPVETTSTAKGGNTLTVVMVGTQPHFVHTYTTTGSSTFAVNDPLDVEYLVVAGGGGGGFGNGNEGGGGGGAGGLRTNVGAPTTVGSSGTTSLAVAVGAGGDGGTSTTSSGMSGANSQFGSVVATGGGGGGSCSAEAASGGSGGGGSGCSRDRPGGGASPSGQGHAGGAGRWINNSPGNGNGGGGGGAGGAGGNGAARDRATTGGGGAGLANTITGTAVIYAVGGDGFAGAPSGGQTNGTGAQGTNNRGNGGGGSAQQTGARGGSGIVVVRHTAVPRP